MAGNPALYSRAVRILRVALPLIAVALMSTIFLVSGREGEIGSDFFAELENEPQLSAGALQPRFSGTSDEAEPFVLASRFARPLPDNPNLYEMEQITGEIDRTDGSKVQFDAEAGTFLQTSQRLILTGEVNVVSSDGYDLMTRGARILFSRGVLELPNKVEIAAPMGSIRADTMRAERVTDPETGMESYRVLFEGHVRVRLEPDQM